MASVFLSYDREDASVARSLALALEKAGHSVWWDRNIKGGAQYSDEIEQALKRAEAVLVLWSPASVRSAWVRDEAAAGRDTGRLVPALIKPIEPPMGFRQYQTIDLTRWKGKAAAKLPADLLDAIGEPAGTDVGERSTPTPERLIRIERRWILGGIAGLLVLIATFAGWRWLEGGSGVATVAVAAADRSPASSTLARDLFVKLGELQSATVDALELVDEKSATDPDFTFLVSSSSEGDRAEASISLHGSNRALLWSKDFERPVAERGDLDQQVALTAAEVLDCARKAIAAKPKVDQHTLKLHLNGCATLSGLAWNDFRSLVPLFRDVTRRAPQFADGWAKLVATEALMIGWETLPNDSPEANTLRKDIAAARRLDPHMPETYWAETLLLPVKDLHGAAEVIARAKQANPDHPAILDNNSLFLFRVGRVREALDEAERAARTNPLSGGLSGSIAMLGWAGRKEAALRELEKAERLWPGTNSVAEERWRYHLRVGDPQEALRMMRSGIAPSSRQLEYYLLARIDPTPANVERAISEARAATMADSREIGGLLLALAEFGREEEIYSLMPQLVGGNDRSQNGLFFRAVFQKFRADPRFMKVARDIGLLDYWQKTGKWPDFCFEPDLPYDCKAEAAKLRKMA